MGELYEAAFGAASPIAWYQQCARAAVAFIFGLVLVRLAGKRAFGHWAAVDIVLSVIVGSSLSRAITGTVPLGGTLAGTAVLVALYRGSAQAAAALPWVSRLVEGRPDDLARDGRLDEAALRRNAMSRRALDEALRQKTVEDIAETRRVTLEPSGQVSVFKKES